MLEYPKWIALTSSATGGLLAVIIYCRWASHYRPRRETPLDFAAKAVASATAAATALFNGLGMM